MKAMAEADDGGIVMPVSGAVIIRPALVLPADVMRNGVRVRAELYGSERIARPRERMSHPRRSDKRVHVSGTARVSSCLPRRSPSSPERKAKYGNGLLHSAKI